MNSLARAHEMMRRSGKWPETMVRQVRDLSLVEMGDRWLVVACDSNAAIGDKPADVLQQSPRITGYSAAKVPVMEVLAAGADPLLLIDNLCVEMEPTGRMLLAGINDLLADTGIEPLVTGSNESNMPTSQTGIGITVIGVAGEDDLLVGGAQVGDVVVACGTPKSGIVIPYDEKDPDIAAPRHIRSVVESGLAHEIVPVGSRGVGAEVEDLAGFSGAASRLAPDPGVDLEISAGSSTCFLVALPPGSVEALTEVTGLPTAVVADLVER